MKVALISLFALYLTINFIHYTNLEEFNKYVEVATVGK